MSPGGRIRLVIVGSAPLGQTKNPVQLITSIYFTGECIQNNKLNQMFLLRKYQQKTLSLFKDAFFNSILKELSCIHIPQSQHSKSLIDSEAKTAWYD